jgi:hypothetical protein
MTIITRHITLIAAMLLLLVGAGHAQQSGLYIPKKGKIFFTGDTATIFSNVVNHGKVGVGKKAVVNFKGKKWQNDAKATITDESNGGEDATGKGGLIRFNGTDSGRQQIDGGYNAATREGPAFSHVQIQNAAGVELNNSTTKVRHELQLSEGHLYLHDNTLVVGDGNPGSISGYDADRFIVTGGTANAGLLVRENIRNRDGWVVFPIGSHAASYTPLAIRNIVAQGDDYHARILDGVKKELFSGNDLIDESVNKTWEIGKRIRPNIGRTEISLQHLIADEGKIFQANRQYAYISYYSNQGWDTSYPQMLPAAGNLTSRNTIQNSGLNNRTLTGKIAAASYFTKMTGKGDTTLKKTRLWFSGYRTDKNNVLVYWTTKPELNVRYFVVQRKLSNEAVFTNHDTVQSKAVGGFSNDFLHYHINDFNNHTANSYYRLLLVNYNGDTSYSNIVVVGGKPGGYQLLLWPNPSPGRFYIGVSGAAAIKYVVIYNTLGQLVRRELVNERSIIEMTIHLPGVYEVAFISHSGQLLETKKLLVTGNY